MSDNARVSPANETSRREALALRNWVEARAQYTEDLARAIVEERVHRSREALEARAQEAGTEAKAYADQGLHVQVSALRALGRAVADLSRQNRELARDRDSLAERLAICESKLERLSLRSDTEAEPPNGVAAGPTGAGNSSVAAGATKLHFHANGAPLAGYLDIDLNADEDAGVFARVKALNIRAGSLQEIMASQIVERVSAPVFEGSLLPRWRECLADDGRLILACLDGEALLARAREMSFDVFRTAISADENGGLLRNLVTPEQLTSMLERAAFVDVEIMFRGQPHRNGFLFQVAARKSAA